MDLTKQNENLNTALLISTTKKYSFILPAFFELMKKYWPNNSLPKYLASNQNLDNYKSKYSVNTIEWGDDPGFIQGWVNAIEKINYDNIILMQEDFLIEKEVNNSLIKEYCHLLNKNTRIGCIRLMPFPPAKGKLFDFKNHLNEFDPEQDYIFSWQTTIWNKDVILKFLQYRLKQGFNKVKKLNIVEIDIKKPRPKPNPYSFFNPEHHGRELYTLFPDKLFLGFSNLLYGHNNFLSSLIPYFPTAIINGKLTIRAMKLLKSENIEILIPKGMFENRVDYFKRKRLKNWRSRIRKFKTRIKIIIFNGLLILKIKKRSN